MMFRPIKSLAIALVAALSLSACEPTAQNTAASLAQERQASQQLVQQLDARDALMEDPELNAYMRSIVDRVAAQRPPGAVPLRSYIVKDGDVNAFTTGGGYLFFNAGMLAALENEAQLATVVAHEIAHIDRGHVLAGRNTRSGVQLGAAAAQIGGALLGINPQLTELGVGVGANLAVSSFTRTQERDADETGVQYLAAAGYNAVEGARSFEVLRRLYGDGGVPFFASHPPTSERQQTLNRMAAELGATQGRIGDDTHDRATRGLRREILEFYDQQGRSREAAQIRRDLRN